MTYINDELLKVYVEATELAMGNQQVVGEKREYNVTLQQLENIVKEIQAEAQ